MYRSKSADMTGGGRFLRRITISKITPDRESTMFTSITLRIPVGLVSRPRLAAGGQSAPVIGIQTIRLHQSGQAGIVRLVAFGTGEGVLTVDTPPFDGFMYPVNGFETGCAVVPVDAVGQIHLVVAVQTQPGKLVIFFRNPRGTAKGGAVEGIFSNRLSRCGMILIPISGNVAPPRLRLPVIVTRPRVWFAGVITAWNRRRCILLVGRGHPGSLEERQGIGLVADGGADTVRIVAAAAQTVDGCRIGHDLIAVAGSNGAVERFNRQGAGGVAGDLAELSAVAAAPHQEIQVFPFVCCPAGGRAIHQGRGGGAGAGTARVSGQAFKGCAGRRGLQVTTDNGLHDAAFGEARSGGLDFGGLGGGAELGRVFVSQDRCRGTKGGGKAPRCLAVWYGRPGSGSVMAVKALSGTGTVRVDSRRVGRRLVIRRVAAHILLGLFQVGAVVGSVEGDVAGGRADDL